MFAYCDYKKRLSVDDKYLYPTYPIVTGYAFYDIMISKVIETGDATTVRNTMILHTLKEEEFYDFVKTGCGWCPMNSPEISEESLSAGLENVLGRLNLSVDEADWRINKCFEARHRFHTKFMRMREILLEQQASEEQKDKDKLLFLAFFAYFDAKLVASSSDRIQKTFKILFGTDAERELFPWENKNFY